jgi:hypothetical protein
MVLRKVQDVSHSPSGIVSHQQQMEETQFLYGSSCNGFRMCFLRVAANKGNKVKMMLDWWALPQGLSTVGGKLVQQCPPYKRILGCVFKPFDPPQPPLKRGENLIKVPLKKGDLIKVPLFKPEL